MMFWPHWMCTLRGGLWSNVSKGTWSAAAPLFLWYAVRLWFDVLAANAISQTHNIPIVADIAAFVVSLSIDGRVLACGAVADVLSHADSKLVAQVEQAKEEDEKEDAVIDAPRPDKPVDVKPKANGKLIVAEEIATGHVSWPARQYDSPVECIASD